MYIYIYIYIYIYSIIKLHVDCMILYLHLMGPVETKKQNSFMQTAHSKLSQLHAV